MKNNDGRIQRHSFMTGMGIAAIGGLAAGAVSVPAIAQQSNAGFQPARYSEDAWFEALGGSHRDYRGDQPDAVSHAGCSAIPHCALP